MPHTIDTTDNLLINHVSQKMDSLKSIKRRRKNYKMSSSTHGLESEKITQSINETD